MGVSEHVPAEQQLQGRPLRVFSPWVPGTLFREGRPREWFPCATGKGKAASCPRPQRCPCGAHCLARGPSAPSALHPMTCHSKTPRQ